MSERIESSIISLKTLSIAIEQSEDGIMITDVNGTIEYVNPAVEKISGYTRDEFIGKNPRIFKSGFHPPEFYKDFWDKVLSGKTFRATFVNKRKDGGIFYVAETISPVYDEEGKLSRNVSVWKDITSEIESERRQRLRNEVIYKILTKVASSTFDELLTYAMGELAKVMGVDSVSLWGLSEDGKKIKRMLLYDLAEGKHYNNLTVIDLDKCPNYSKLIRGSSLVHTSDVEFDQRINELWNDYWGPLGIRAVVVVPLFCGAVNESLGIICFEHRERRKWGEEDISFAERIPQLICLIFMNDQLQSEKLKLRGLMETAPGGIMFLSSNGEVLETNSRGRELLEFFRERERERELNRLLAFP